MDYSATPAILFTYPQYGMVGCAEDSHKAEGIAYSKGFGKNLTELTYRRVGMSNAAYKILVGTYGYFLDALILADNSAGIINTIGLAILNRVPVETLFWN
jgi:glutathione reductase (NADPH)